MTVKSSSVVSAPQPPSTFQLVLGFYQFESGWSQGIGFENEALKLWDARPGQPPTLKTLTVSEACREAARLVQWGEDLELEFGLESRDVDPFAQIRFYEMAAKAIEGGK